MLYILEGHTPIPEPNHKKWSEWFYTADRRVAETEVSGVKISTVFVGIDSHNHSGPPRVFETCVFGGKLDLETLSYATWDDAVSGHQEMISKVQKSLH